MGALCSTRPATGPRKGAQNTEPDPTLRGRGFGRLVTGRLCMSLLEQVDEIALDVHAQNRAAIAMYERLGFTVHCGFEECVAVLAGVSR